MDSCEHDFLIAISGKRSYLLLHILHLSAAYPPSGIGNDTVGAELVAAILYFDISPGVFTCTGKVKRKRHNKKRKGGNSAESIILSTL